MVRARWPSSCASTAALVSTKSTLSMRERTRRLSKRHNRHAIGAVLEVRDEVGLNRGAGGLELVPGAAGVGFEHAAARVDHEERVARDASTLDGPRCCGLPASRSAGRSTIAAASFPVFDDREARRPRRPEPARPWRRARSAAAGSRPGSSQSTSDGVSLTRIEAGCADATGDDRRASQRETRGHDRSDATHRGRPPISAPYCACFRRVEKRSSVWPTTISSPSLTSLVPATLSSPS